MLQKTAAYILPETKSTPPAQQRQSFSSLATAIVAFLYNPVVLATQGTMQYFSINGSNYAILPEGDVDWINGSCGAVWMESGIAVEEIVEVCSPGALLGADGWSKLFSGLNTSANMTSELMCLVKRGKHQCDAQNDRVLIGIGIAASAFAVCVGACALVCHRIERPNAPQHVPLLEPGAAEPVAEDPQPGVYQGQPYQLGDEGHSRAEGEPGAGLAPADDEQIEGEPDPEQTHEGGAARI